MLGNLFTRHRGPAAQPAVPRVIEPVSIPSPQKRQEKERKWIESISHRSNKIKPSSSSHPPLPSPVEFIAASTSKVNNDNHGLLDRWSSSPHKRGTTTNTAAVSSTQEDHRSLRTTRSASALASKLGDSLKNTLGRSSSTRRKSKETPSRERQSSNSSSLLSDCTAHPPSSASIPRTPPLLQLSGDQDCHASSFVHVPQLSPSSALLSPQSRNLRAQSYFEPSNSSASRLAAPTPSTTQTRTSTFETSTKSLAARLQELEHANNVGLLNDEEYRVLRQNLFEKNVGGSDNTVSITSLASVPVLDRPLSTVQDAGVPIGQRTGTLLGLPRLHMSESDTRAAASQPQAPPSNLQDPEPSYLPIPSNTSIHSKSRFSLRSSKSNLTTRSAVSSMSRLFRRGGGGSAPGPSSSSTTAQDQPLHFHDEDEIPPLPVPNAARVAAQDGSAVAGDGESMNSIPVSLTRKLGKKNSIPKDWKELQSLHLKESQREEAKQLSRKESTIARTGQRTGMQRGGIDSMYVNASEVDGEKEETMKRVDSGYRTMRRSSMNPIQTSGSEENFRTSVSSSSLDRLASTHFTKSSSDPVISSHLPSQSTDTTSSNAITEAHGRDVNPRTSRAFSVSSSTTTNTPSYSAAPPTSSLVIIQPGDEDLDSIGLRHAMSTLKAENERLLSQFKDLELKLYEKYGDPALEIIQSSSSTREKARRDERRRESLSMSYLETGSTFGRRMSISSSTFSTPQARNSVLGSSGASLQPSSASIVRRPSKTSSIASSSSMRRGFSSSSSGTAHHLDVSSYSRPPSTVQEEILFTAIEAEIAGGDEAATTRPSVRDPQYEKEMQLLNERRRNIEERYAARLEYLEARLKGQLQKEKLRR